MGATSLSSPIQIELLPVSDRKSVVILVRSDEAIPMSTLIQTLEDFSKMLFDRFMKDKSKIISLNKPIE